MSGKCMYKYKTIMIFSNLPLFKKFSQLQRIQKKL